MRHAKSAHDRAADIKCTLELRWNEEAGVWCVFATLEAPGDGRHNAYRCTAHVFSDDFHAAMVHAIEAVDLEAEYSRLF